MTLWTAFSKNRRAFAPKVARMRNNRWSILNVKQRKALWLTATVLVFFFLFFSWTRMIYLHSSTVASDSNLEGILGNHNKGQKRNLLSSMNSTACHANLPIWMQEYVAWHRVQIASLTEENWRSHKFLVARCLDIDQACGGVSDRLKSLPVLVLLASQSRRILLIHWSRPARLEEFLIPNKLSLNWSRPDFVPVKGLGTRLYTKLTTLVKATVETNSTVPVVCTRLQDQHGGSEYYNAHALNAGTDRAFRKVFRSLFFSVFAPSPAVLQQLFLDAPYWAANSYVAAHLRANYGDRPLEGDQLRDVSINTVNCASHLVFPVSIGHASDQQTRSSIGFLSDSFQASKYVDAFAKENHHNVYAFTEHASGAEEPLHLDKAGSANAADYRSIFVDLLFMANARCIVHGQGGFGRMGVLLSHDPTCFLQMVENGKYITCSWTNRSTDISGRSLDVHR